MFHRGKIYPGLFDYVVEFLFHQALGIDNVCLGGKYAVLCCLTSSCRSQRLWCCLIPLMLVLVPLIHLAVVEMYQMLTVEPGWVKHGDWHIHHSPVVHERSPPLLPPFLKILFLLSSVRVVHIRFINLDI